MDNENGPRRDTTELLNQWRAGNQRVLEPLLERIEGELRRLARTCLRGERPDHSLPSAALVNEAFLRLVAQRGFQNRAHFFALAARTMRRILIDHARGRRTAKRGGELTRVTFDEALDSPAETGPDPAVLLALHDALEELERLDPRQARIVELRAFAGLNNAEIAEALGVSTATIKREWSMARAWLHGRLAGDDPC